MSFQNRVPVRGYRYTTLIPSDYREGIDPIPVRTDYEIVRLIDFPENYIHGRLESYYESFIIHNDEGSTNEFRQRDGLEIVFDLKNDKFCEIDLKLIDPSTLRQFQTTIPTNPTEVYMTLPMLSDSDT